MCTVSGDRLTFEAAREEDRHIAVAGQAVFQALEVRNGVGPAAEIMLRNLHRGS
jgi:hypothetical protein